MSNSPMVSVIVPCYNADRYINQMLDSMFAQTLDDFEIICVNNASTDDTLQTLNHYAAEHENMTVLEEPTPGSGLARNAGLAIARGKWLYFPDADDFSRPELLEHAVAYAEAEAADIVVFGIEEYDDLTSEIRPARHAIETPWLPEGEHSFSPADYADHVLTSFQNWAWNKLFRASFIREHDIVFQDTRRTTDLLFTCRALTEASRIAVLDEPLHFYRTNNPKSAIVTSSAHPLDFYKGFLALRHALEEHGTWELYHNSFLSWAVDGIAVNVYFSREFGGFEKLVSHLKNEGLHALDVDQCPREVALSEMNWESCMAIRDLPIEQVAFRYFQLDKRAANDLRTDLSFARLERGRLESRIRELEGELQDTRSSLDDARKRQSKAESEARKLRSSNSWKIGRAITLPVRKAKALAKSRSKRS